MTVIYGIANCDTVKKARAWLAANGLAYEFVDFKKQPPSVGLIESWLTQIPLDALLNKRGTTWRKLTPQQQAEAADPQGAVKLMAEQPSIIKRPYWIRTAAFTSAFAKKPTEHCSAASRSAASLSDGPTVCGGRLKGACRVKTR